MSQIFDKPMHIPHTPPITPPRGASQDQPPPGPPPQPWDALFTIQAQAERCRYLERHLASERRAHAAILDETNMIRQTAQALSLVSAQTRRELEEERARADKAEKRLRDSEVRRKRAESAFKEGHVKQQKMENTIRALRESVDGTMSQAMEAMDAVKVLEVAVCERYRNQWELIKRLAGSSQMPVPVPMLRFRDIPWPTFSAPTVPGDITKQEVQRFLHASSGSSDGKSARKLVKEWLLVWHPDKFCGRWLPHVVDSEKLLVQRGTSVVAQLVNGIMREVGGC